MLRVLDRLVNDLPVPLKALLYVLGLSRPGTAQVPFDPAPLKGSLRQMETWLGSQRLELAAALKPPCTRVALQRLTAQRGVAFPEEVYVLYTWHNGMACDTALFGDYHFQPIEEALASADETQKFENGPYDFPCSSRHSIMPTTRWSVQGAPPPRPPSIGSLKARSARLRPSRPSQRRSPPASIRACSPVPVTAARPAARPFTGYSWITSRNGSGLPKPYCAGRPPDSLREHRYGPTRTLGHCQPACRRTHSRGRRAMGAQSPAWISNVRPAERVEHQSRYRPAAANGATPRPIHSQRRLHRSRMAPRGKLASRPKNRSGCHRRPLEPSLYCL
ncbi:hypothetical protein SBA3_4040002 [Candidatus Sulfopaludibacter sp. SbA3]|nr:hypothetical protein SBA3_4040002 [Candidatus Sulfopaludibacter sp. SbA3]